MNVHIFITFAEQFFDARERRGGGLRFSESGDGGLAVVYVRPSDKKTYSHRWSATWFNANHDNIGRAYDEIVRDVRMVISLAHMPCDIVAVRTGRNRLFKASSPISARVAP